jgi:hypothetical protein
MFLKLEEDGRLINNIYTIVHMFFYNNHYKGISHRQYTWDTAIAFSAEDKQ